MSAASNIISVGWLVENQILKIQIGGAPDTHTLTISDNEHYDDVALAYLESATQTVNIIVHLQPALSNPPVASLLRLRHPRHPRVDHVFVVNASATPIARFFISIISSMSGVKLKSAASMDEAMSLIEASKQASEGSI